MHLIWLIGVAGLMLAVSALFLLAIAWKYGRRVLWRQDMAIATHGKRIDRLTKNYWTLAAKMNAIKKDVSHNRMDE